MRVFIVPNVTGATLAVCVKVILTGLSWSTKTFLFTVFEMINPLRSPLYGSEMSLLFADWLLLD